MCLFPKLIKNRKYTETKKNGGNVPQLKDERVIFVPVGCGNCVECRKQKSREWQVRLSEDIKTNTNGKFVTLTFSNEQYTKLTKEIEAKGYLRDNMTATLAVRRFLERWRKEFKKSVRHWLVTELGHNGTENIHLHGIIWTDKKFETIEKHWQYGHIYPNSEQHRKGNYVSIKTVNYIVKYVSKLDQKHSLYKPVILSSPGIGGNYKNTYNAKLNKFNGNQTRETYKTNTGHEIALPVYWRNAIYNDEEREQLWLNRLDKKERWVCGERVSIKDGEEEYKKLLKYYQEKNKRLGYGDRNWKLLEYEQQRRELMHKMRIGAKAGIAPGSAI